MITYLMLYTIIFINGIYDIICGLSLIFTPNLLICKIHADIFKAEYNDNILWMRMMGYWIFTYGVIRASIMNNTPTIKTLVAASYFIEAYAFAFENIYHKTTISYKVLWIFVSSSVIGLWLLLPYT